MNIQPEQNSATSEISRRQFVTKTAAAGAAAATGLSIARSAHAAGKQEIKIGMIGCGNRCSGAANQSLLAGPDVKLVAMCDIFADRARIARKTLKKLFPEQVVCDDDHLFVGFDGYKKVIDSVDVVLIACASKFHPMYAEAGIKAGKHVFVEKPHGIDPVGVRRVQAACDLAKEKNLSLLSGCQSRFHHGYQQCIQRIHDGAIGDVVAMQVMFLRGPYQTVNRNRAYTETQYQFSNWYHFRWLSGDDVTQSLVHNMDRVGWILHEQSPVSCFGLAGRSASYGEVYGDMFDHHTAVYEYPGGTRVYALCRTQNGCYGNCGDVVMGSKGICYLGSHIEGKNAWRFKGPGNDPYLDEQRALIESVRTGKPINSGYHMAKGTMAAVMGQMACFAGRALRWDEVANSNYQFGPAPEQSTFDTPPPSTPDASGNYPLLMPGITKVI